MAGNIGGVDKPLSEMPFDQQIDWTVGCLALRIGMGDFKSGVNLVLQQFMDIGFARGAKHQKHLDAKEIEVLKARIQELEAEVLPTP
jgi:hypothetical protein